MKKIKHNNHLWKTYSGVGTADKNDSNLDICAYCAGDIHNGPKCMICGYGFCHHCYPDGYDTKCEIGYFTCEKCGSVIAENDKFCKNCGMSLEESEETDNE